VVLLGRNPKEEVLNRRPDLFPSFPLRSLLVAPSHPLPVLFD